MRLMAESDAKDDSPATFDPRVAIHAYALSLLDPQPGGRPMRGSDPYHRLVYRSRRGAQQGTGVVHVVHRVAFSDQIESVLSHFEGLPRIPRETAAARSLLEGWLSGT
jgi:hypothetical protein